MHITIQQCEWDGDQALVTWYWDNDDGPGVPTVTVASVEYEPADPGVGIHAGFSVSCDGPRTLEDLVANLATEQRYNRLYDCAELASESRSFHWADRWDALVEYERCEF